MSRISEPYDSRTIKKGNLKQTLVVKAAIVEYKMLLDFRHITRNLNITGIIHAGAHTAEEREIYGNIPVIWIEADPELYRDLLKKFEISPLQGGKAKGQEGVLNQVHHFAATGYTGTAELNIMPFRAANSLLKAQSQCKTPLRCLHRKDHHGTGTTDPGNPASGLQFPQPRHPGCGIGRAERHQPVDDRLHLYRST